MNNGRMNKKENALYLEIKEILNTAREKAYSAVNFAMVNAYWLIGRQIVQAQDGNTKAKYGSSLLKYLSERLTNDFGKGFDESNLRYIRQFYLTFQIHGALRHELSWSHYRKIMKIENEEDKSESVVRYTLPENNKQIFTSKYKLYLPTEEELCRELENEKKMLVEEYELKQKDGGKSE